MGGKKKKSSTKKKNPRKSTTPPDFDTVLTQADSALEASDIDTALRLYHYASTVLRKNIEKRTEGIDGSEGGDIIMLAKVLGKMGEVKVSMDDQEGGYADFSEAIEILQVSPDAVCNSQVTKQQWSETKASLYLYLGQLCAGEEALECYTNGVEELKECISSMERTIADGGIDRDKLKVSLIETR